MDQATAILDGRTRLKMSQEHLASAAGISARTVVRAEAGLRVSGESLRNICAVLGLDASEVTLGAAEGDAAARTARREEAPPRATAASEAEDRHPPPVSPVPSVARGDEPATMPVWRRLAGLRRTYVEGVAALVLSLVGLAAMTPTYERLISLGDTRRWLYESYSSKTVATYVNAIASGRPARAPAMFYFAWSCGPDGEGEQDLLRYMDFTKCTTKRHDILVETAMMPDGAQQTVIGPVGRSFGGDVARRLSGDPGVEWKVAFASGRRASGLAWFDPRIVEAQDMPRPPNSDSTWVYLRMSKTGN